MEPSLFRLVTTAEPLLPGLLTLIRWRTALAIKLNALMLSSGSYTALGTIGNVKMRENGCGGATLSPRFFLHQLAVIFPCFSFIFVLFVWIELDLVGLGWILSYAVDHEMTEMNE